MDVKCATCQEPWEAYHLLHELPSEIWDGDNTPTDLLIKKFKQSSKSSIPEQMREDLADQGWKFGKTIVCVLECCCCSDYDELDDQDLIEIRKQLRLEAEELLGDDLDGLISTLSGIDIYAEMDPELNAGSPA